MSALTVAGSIPEELLSLSGSDLRALMMRANPGVWAEEARGFHNVPLHWEWYRLMPMAMRLAIVAPREHAKTECFTVNQTAWRSIYQAGTWTYVFANTLDQGMEIKDRIDRAVEEAQPQLVDHARIMTKKETTYSNLSRVTVGGAGKAVRGAHPDVIIGDDVLEEDTSMSRMHREKLSRWWLGTVSNMAHPGTTRTIRGGRRVTMPATRVFLVGTPFHQEDLLMSMKKNPMYRFRRYAAEYAPEDLVDGLAVEIG